MHTPPSVPPLTLWSIHTRSSVVSCQLVRPFDGSFELRLMQSDEIVLTQPFADEASLRSYADALRERLTPLADGKSTDVDPDRKAG